MEKFVGRFRIRDCGRTVRRCDSSEEEFMSRVHAGGGEPQEKPAAETSTRGGEPAERPADGTAEAAKRWKENSDRRWGNGQLYQSDTRRAYADANLSPAQRFRAASDRRWHDAGSTKDEVATPCSCNSTPADKFKAASRARWSIVLLVALLLSGMGAAAQTLTPNLQLTLPKYGQSNWDTLINGDFSKIDTAIGNLQLPYQGSWSSSAIYSRGQEVTYSGSVYASLINSNTNILPTNAHTWMLLPSGSSSSATFQTNGTNNASQAALDFINSTANATGLSFIVSNPSGGAVQGEIDGYLALTHIASIGANTILGNATGSSGPPTALTVPSCSGGTNALTWTIASGFGCNSITASSVTVGFGTAYGTVSSDASPRQAASHSGTVTKCAVTVTASDSTTPFQFQVRQNGTDVFSSDPTIAAGSASCSTSACVLYYSLSSASLTVNQGDVFQFNILQGAAAWKVTLQLE